MNIDIIRLRHKEFATIPILYLHNCDGKCYKTKETMMSEITYYICNNNLCCYIKDLRSALK